MELHRKEFSTTLSGMPATLEVSEVAKQASAAVIGRLGDTTVLATVVMGGENKDTDYFPLTVDYEERFYATGKILGSRFVRREGKASDEATLSARLIDRTIRPLFDPHLRREVHVVVTILSYDEKNDPEAIALLAVSAALSISDIPWGGPVAGVRSESRAADGTLEFLSFFAGTEGRINMIEFEGNERSEKEAVELFEKAHEEVRRLIAFQKDMVKSIGKPKSNVELSLPSPELRAKVKAYLAPHLDRVLAERSMEDLHTELRAYLTEQGESPESLANLLLVFEEEVDAYVHQMEIEGGKRPDGRKFDEVRDLYAGVKILPRTHGSGLFMRGDTQVLAVTTLASPDAEQLVETMEATSRRRFMLHYNFPSFATGETGRNRGPGRREIGHGALAAKALRAVIPPKEVFPYTIRIVAETLSSNGSSSQASTCAGCLSLMDAGVPIRKPVAGIAMGLMSDQSGKYRILTDIQGPEDHYGDMDLKVAGTSDGLTAVQMDVKIDGITKQIFEEALAQARAARIHILSVMAKTISAPRAELSEYAPKILIIQIPPEKIGEVIGPGGRVINGIRANYDNTVDIDIEEDGKVFVSGLDRGAVESAANDVRQIVREYKVGEIVEGPVIKILDFGAIVDLGGGRDGMIHVSELREGFVKSVEEVVHLGDRVRARIIRVEEGRTGLSLKNVPNT